MLREVVLYDGLLRLSAWKAGSCCGISFLQWGLRRSMGLVYVGEA